MLGALSSVAPARSPALSLHRHVLNPADACRLWARKPDEKRRSGAIGFAGPQPLGTSVRSTRVGKLWFEAGLDVFLAGLRLCRYPIDYARQYIIRKMM